MGNRKLCHERLTKPPRVLGHERITAPPAQGESPEAVLEVALRQVWEVRLNRQQAWLDDRQYASVEDKVLVESQHANLSPQALELLDMIIQAPEAITEAIRHTPLNIRRPSSRYTVKGGNSQPNRISRKRFINFLVMYMGVGQNKAARIAEEIDSFNSVLIKYSTNQ